MNCRECKEHLYEYLDRELTPVVEQEIRQHLTDCPPCGEQFDFEKLFLGFLRAIDLLPEQFRETVVLSDVEGMSYEEIARILEVPVGTVKSRLFRARRLLQQKLYDYAVGMGYIKGSAK